MSSLVALTKSGWTHVQVDLKAQLVKQWTEDGQTYKAEAFFGTLLDGKFSPAVIVNVYCQGCGTSHIIDDNCDVWENVFTTTTKEEGNGFYQYLLKHNFKRVSIAH